jgi:hypothetical protein
MHKVTEEMVKEFSTSRMYKHLKAWKWPVRPITVDDRRQEMLKAIKQSKEFRRSCNLVIVYDKPLFSSLSLPLL